MKCILEKILWLGTFVRALVSGQRSSSTMSFAWIRKVMMDHQFARTSGKVINFTDLSRQKHNLALIHDNSR